MSRIANSPIDIPTGVEVTLQGQNINIKGKLGELSWKVHDKVEVNNADNQLSMKYDYNEIAARALAGTTRALLANMVHGVSQGYECKLTLVGVGYRVQVSGKKINLALGFSHPVEVELADGLTAESPTQTELVIKGIDKQKVFQTGAEIRAIRPPEPYKGKGVRYADEVVIKKEGKKK